MWRVTWICPGRCDLMQGRISKSEDVSTWVKTFHASQGFKNRLHKTYSDKREKERGWREGTELEFVVSSEFSQRLKQTIARSLCPADLCTAGSLAGPAVWFVQITGGKNLHHFQFEHTWTQNLLIIIITTFSPRLLFTFPLLALFNVYFTTNSNFYFLVMNKIFVSSPLLLPLPLHLPCSPNFPSSSLLLSPLSLSFPLPCFLLSPRTGSPSHWLHFQSITCGVACNCSLILIPLEELVECVCVCVKAKPFETATINGR